MAGIFVAVPAYDGRACVETTRALIDECRMARELGVDLVVGFASGSSLVTQARNQLVGEFLDSDHDRMVFVDADMAWEPGALLRVASHPVECCGGAYRLKMDAEHYAVQWQDKPELWADPATGLLEVNALPTGFLCLTRDAIERFRKHYHPRFYVHMQKAFFAYFHNPWSDGEFWGEDIRFCHEFRQAGGRVWLDPELALSHVGGSREHKGKIGDWLRGRPSLGVPTTMKIKPKRAPARKSSQDDAALLAAVAGNVATGM